MNRSISPTGSVANNFRVLALAAGLATSLWPGAPAHAAEEPAVVSLDGIWQIAESVSATEIPQGFTHTVPVPGLVNLARPAFPQVDDYASRELIVKQFKNSLPASPQPVTMENERGVSRQPRNYFWYRTTFRPARFAAIALLKIGKAQFGTAVWLNGVAVGEYAGCFSAGTFNLTQAVKWDADNVLLVRIGAHPGVLPATFPSGTDAEKLKWTPGIYDRVTLHLCDNPVIETVQVAPRLTPSEIVVQTRLHNYGPACTTTLSQRVRPWKGEGAAVAAEPLSLALMAGEVRDVTQVIPLPGARLWSPEDPFLHVVESRTGGDAATTRFGMREFRCDSATQRLYLNGQPYYLRGSNITLHRFFEDPLCGHLPWDEAWLHRLLAEIPRQMHWNSFRFCIGPVPDRWLEIADEAGLLIQNEFFVWTERRRDRRYDLPETIRQYGDWMRDNWNHPSVAIWDATNETLEPIFAERIIPAVRPLDLSHRPWENSFNGPPGPNDLVEEHPYQFIDYYLPKKPGRKQFEMSDLETKDGELGAGSPFAGKYARIVNEYGWLWLNRDGSPTELTRGVYDHLLGPAATADERLSHQAYLMAGITEFARTGRHYAGVHHFVYLTGSFPGVFTADHWADVGKLILEPYFADYLAEAFKPLGVYINFFQPTLPAAAEHAFSIKLVNDHDRPLQGRLTLTLETAAGATVARTEGDFSLPPLGAGAVELHLAIPDVSGKHTLRASASAAGQDAEPPTISRRRVTVEND